MIAVIQRVTAAKVRVGGEVVGEIGVGLAVLAAVHAEDTEAEMAWTAAKIVGLRIFPNGEKAYDLDVMAAKGGLLVVSNFTVAAETAKGRRPSLNPAAGPEKARGMFEVFVEQLRRTGVAVAIGVFGADMAVEIHNDGPSTFVVNSREGRAKEQGG